MSEDNKPRKISNRLQIRLLTNIMYCWACLPCQRRMMDSLSGTDDGVKVELQLACPICDLRIRMYVMHHSLEEGVYYEPWRINDGAVNMIRKQIEMKCQNNCPYIPRMNVRTGYIGNLPCTERPVPSISNALKNACMTGNWDVPPETNKE